MTTSPAAAATSSAPLAPPGPADAVALATIQADPLGFLLRMVAEHGDVSRHQSEGWNIVLANTPAAARQVLRGNRRNYTKEGTPDESMLVPLLGRGLLTSEGELWKRQRRVVQPAFRPHVVSRFDGLMTEAAVEVADRWLATPAGEPVRVDRDLTALALAVVARAILGSDVATMGPRFGEAVDAVNRFMGHYDPGSADADIARDRAAFGNARAFLDRLVKLLVDARRFGEPPAEGEAADVLDALLAGGTGDVEIRDQVLTILMAGHETTAKSLTWTLYLLDQHPEERARVEAEVDAVLGTGDARRLPTAADAERLVACRNAVAEAMRLYPPVWLLSRIAIERDEIEGFEIEPGTLVCISPYVLHRHPDLWEEPERFDPTRFEREDPDPFAYVPFSGGPRQCVGKELALLETQLVVAVLCSRLRARLVSGHPVEAEALVTLRPRHGMAMTIEPRT